MKFRQKAPLRIQEIIISYLLLIIYIVTAFLTEFYFLLIFSSVSIITLLSIPKRYNKYITIDEVGIRCTEKEQQLWAFSWGEIDELKKFSPHNMPAVAIMVYPKNQRNIILGNNDHYFQLTKTSKNALRKYAGDLWRY